MKRRIRSRIETGHGRVVGISGRLAKSCTAILSRQARIPVAVDE